MKFGKYLKDRLYSVIIYIFVIIAVILLMTAFKSQIELKITVGIIITLLWISEIFIDFFRKKRYFDEHPAAGNDVAICCNHDSAV